MRPKSRIRPASTARVRRSSCAWGFTLVELLTTLSVLAVVAALTAPAMRSFAAGQQVKALAYDMTGDLLLARSEALKRNVSVSLTASGTNWASGWTVAAGVENIGTRNAANESLSFSATPSVPSVITFDINGRVSAPSSQVRLTISSSAAPGDSAKRCIQLDLSGRARSLVGACA